MALLVLGFLVVAGAFVLAQLNGVKADVASLDALPDDVFICDHFKPSSGVVIVSSGSQRRYNVSGDCPQNTDSLSGELTGELEYRGWTVHVDNDGNINAYNYASHEAMNVGIEESPNQDNAASVEVLVFTGQDKVPADFPSPPS